MERPATGVMRHADAGYDIAKQSVCREWALKAAARGVQPAVALMKLTGVYAEQVRSP